MINSSNNNSVINENKLTTEYDKKSNVTTSQQTLFGHKVTVQVKGEVSEEYIKLLLDHAKVGKTSFVDGMAQTKLKSGGNEIKVHYQNSDLKTQLNGMKNQKLFQTEAKTKGMFETIIGIFTSKPKPLPLDSKELQTIARFSALIREQKPPTEQETREMAALVAKSLGNMEVNKQMSALLKDPKKLAVYDQQLVDTLRSLTFRSRGWEQADRIAAKTENLMRALHNGEQIPNKDKLTLAELGTIESLVKAKNGFEMIKELELDKIDPKLASFVAAFERSDRVMEQAQMILQKYSNLKNGDLMFVNIDKENRFRSSEGSSAQARETYILDMPLHHAGVNFRSGETDTLSQIMGKYEHEPNDLQSRITSSAYRLDASRLLSKDGGVHELLRHMYESQGKDYLEEVSKMYQNVQKDLHSQGISIFENVVNDESRRDRSGLAHILTFLQKSTKENSPERYQELHDAMMKGDLNAKKMICSEFAAKTLIAGLVEQEARLKDQLVDFLKKGGMSDEQAVKIVNELAIFEMPFGDDESLSRMSPSRLLETLARQGIINRIEPHPMLQALVQADELKSDPRENVIPLADISGYNADEANKAKLKQDVPLGAPRVPKDNHLSSKWNNMEMTEGVNTFEAKLIAATRPKSGENKSAKEKLYEMIGARRNEIRELKESWKAKLQGNPRTRYDRLNKKGVMEPVTGGMGGTYKLKSDKRGAKTEFYVKPNDQDMNCLNNPKVMASPLDSSKASNRNRTHIPKYRAAQTEALSWEVAQACGLSDITPETHLAVLRNDAFHDVLEGTAEAEQDKETISRLAGEADKEKLCSVQVAVENEMDMNRLMDMQLDNNWTDKQAAGEFKAYCDKNILHSDFEKCLLFACITGETDGNTGNYLLVKTKDENGNDVFGIRKIDNALCFPDANGSEFQTNLENLPNISRPLTEAGRNIIRNIDQAAIGVLIKKYFGENASEAAIKAFNERIMVLKRLAEQPGVTLEDLADAMADIKKAKSSSKKVGFAEPDPVLEPIVSPRMRSSTVYTNAPLNSSVIRMPESPRGPGVITPRSPRPAENADQEDIERIRRSSHIGPNRLH